MSGYIHDTFSLQHTFTRITRVKVNDVLSHDFAKATGASPHIIQMYQACFDFSNRDFGMLFFYHKAPNKSITYTDYLTYNGLPVHNING